MSEPAKKRKPGPKPVEAPEPTEEPKAPPPASTPSVAEIRRRRRRQLAVRLALWVGLPTLLAAVYYGLIASPQYESVTTFTIQSTDSHGPASLEFLIASVPGSGATRDSMLVRDYVTSRDMLRTLESEQDFTAHYSSEQVDYFSRLDPDASFEETYDYYKDHVEAEYDGQSGSVTLRIRAFSADKSRALAGAILEASEDMVNRMMAKAREDRIEMASEEVQRAEERLSDARKELLDLQGERSEINPRASAEAVLTVRSTLEAELATARAELNTMRATLQPGTPQLVAQQQRVSALSRQVEEQTRRLAARSEGGDLSSDIAAFEPAMAEKEFAQRAYESAVTSLEVARLEAARQHRYLVTISEPSMPDAPSHPRRFLAVLTVFVLAFALFGIASLFIASMREHANL